MTLKATRVNLGCGDNLMPGYLNLDLKFGHAIYPLHEMYLDREGRQVELVAGGLEEIRASHVLEHFSHRTTRAVLADWVAHLRPGGLLRIAVPDFGRIARAYAGGEALPVAAFVLGGQKDEHDYHQALFDEPQLRGLLEEAGIERIRPWLSPINDCASLAISLNLMGTKRLETKEQDHGNNDCSINEEME